MSLSLQAFYYPYHPCYLTSAHAFLVHMIDQTSLLKNDIFYVNKRTYQHRLRVNENSKCMHLILAPVNVYHSRRYVHNHCIRAFVRIATPPKLKAMAGSYISLV